MCGQTAEQFGNSERIIKKHYQGRVSSTVRQALTAPQAAVALTIRCGGTAVIMERFDPEAYLALVEKYKVTHSQLVPTMFSRMLKLPEAVRTRYDLSSLEIAIHAAIARRFGPYKLSLHSGSDKFSVYPTVVHHTRGVVHIEEILAALREQGYRVDVPADEDALIAMAEKRLISSRRTSSGLRIRPSAAACASPTSRLSSQMPGRTRISRVSTIPGTIPARSAIGRRRRSTSWRWLNAIFPATGAPKLP